MSPRSSSRGCTDPGLRLAACAAVALATGLLAVPRAPGALWLTRDAMEYVSIANAWVHGAGFVDPVQWLYQVREAPPLPAAAVRAPAVPALLALPLALGAGLAEIFVLCACWAALVAGAAVWVASGFMGLSAAMAVGLLLGTAPAWIAGAPLPMTEVTGVAAVLAVLATAGGVLRSPSAAALCAIATLAAWLARPNLGALSLAVVVAALWTGGPRRTLRSASLWTYAATFAVTLLLVRGGSALTSGVAIYAGYASEVLDYTQEGLYQRDSAPALDFVRTHADEVLGIVRLRLVQVCRALCVEPAYHRLGWLLPLALPVALLRRGPGALERRFCALAGAGLTLVVVGNYAFYDPRYLVPPLVLGLLCIGVLLDEGTRGLAQRLGARGLPRTAAWAAGVPLLLALLVTAAVLPTEVGSTLERWRAFRRDGAPDLLAIHARLARLCPFTEADARVVTPDPWSMAFVCGNAALLLPEDLGDPSLRRRFVAEMRPRYFVSDGRRELAWLGSEPGFRRVAGPHRLALFEVGEGGAAVRPWTAPPPPVCAGRSPDCVRPTTP